MPFVRSPQQIFSRRCRFRPSSPEEDFQMRVSLFAAAVAILLSGASVQAQQFPSKPIRLIVPQAAGSNTDIVGRALANERQGKPGQPVVVDNRPGAGLIIGLELTAKSPADGYTLCMSPIGALVISPHMFEKLPYSVE